MPNYVELLVSLKFVGGFFFAFCFVFANGFIFNVACDCVKQLLFLKAGFLEETNFLASS